VHRIELMPPESNESRRNSTLPFPDFVARLLSFTGVRSLESTFYNEPDYLLLGTTSPKQAGAIESSQIIDTDELEAQTATQYLVRFFDTHTPKFSLFFQSQCILVARSILAKGGTLEGLRTLERIFATQIQNNLLIRTIIISLLYRINLLSQLELDIDINAFTNGQITADQSQLARENILKEVKKVNPQIAIWLQILFSKVGGMLDDQISAYPTLLALEYWFSYNISYSLRVYGGTLPVIEPLRMIDSVSSSLPVLLKQSTESI
jgi:hypothetical protein